LESQIDLSAIHLNESKENAERYRKWCLLETACFKII
jgi:hypothetical protein